MEGNLYHKQKALNLYIEKNLSHSESSLISFGIGPSFFWERNQYMGAQAAVSPGSPFDVSVSDYTMYKAGEFGFYTFFSAERKFKNRYALGVKLDLTYLITIEKLYNMALMPYIKVEL
jgi:hypothetical protein